MTTKCIEERFATKPEVLDGRASHTSQNALAAELYIQLPFRCWTNRSWEQTSLSVFPNTDYDCLNSRCHKQLSSVILWLFLDLDLIKLFSDLPPAPLKLRLYGAIEIRLLLLTAHASLILFFFAHQHKAAGVKTKQKQRLRRLIRRLLCWGRRPHSPAAELWTGVETGKLFLWCPGWWLWCVCQSPGLAQ